MVKLSPPGKFPTSFRSFANSAISHAKAIRVKTAERNAMPDESRVTVMCVEKDSTKAINATAAAAVVVSSQTHH